MLNRPFFRKYRDQHRPLFISYSRVVKRIKEVFDMFNFNENPGYIGHSRSKRSQLAIKHFEVPLSMIDRDMIESLTDNLLSKKEISQKQANWLKRIPIYVWKSQTPTSFHHTGLYFNATNHYDLKLYAEEFLKDKSLVQDSINEHRKSKKAKAAGVNYTFATYKHNVWSRRRHLIGKEYGLGFIEEGSNKLIPMISHNPRGSMFGRDKSYSLLNSRNLDYDEFNKFSELIKEYPEYLSAKKKIQEELKYHKLQIK